MRLRGKLQFVDIWIVKHFGSGHVALVSTAGAFVIAIAAFLAVLAVARTRPGPLETETDRKRALDEAMTAVLPPEFRELRRSFGGCGASFTTRNPDCVSVASVDFSRTQQERIDLLKMRAESAGWSVGIGDVGAGTYVGFSHGNFAGGATIWGKAYTDRCASGQKPAEDCADHIQIERK